MKKFFQIAAFAVVGFIAFTSAKGNPFTFYLTQNTSTEICDEVLGGHDITPAGDMIKILLEEFNGVSWVVKTFTSAQDAQSFVFNSQIHRCITPFVMEAE